MNFYLMAYRKDIFSELSLSVPDTWQEVYYQTPPVYQNSMSMQGVNLDTYLCASTGAAIIRTTGWTQRWTAPRRTGPFGYHRSVS